MMPIELGKPPLLVIATGEDETAWHAGRDEGVTASEIHRIARGSRATWRSILADKLNGSTFRGNRHTRRGHEREEYLIAWANATHGGIRPNRALFGHRDHTRHRATPDGLGWSSEEGSFGVEVKSHEYGHDLSRIPQPHYDQMQFGMWVLGYDAWLYVVEVMGEDGTPTLDEPTARWVTRDANRITYLASQADEFLAWRDAGAPELDDIPESIDDALAQWAIARDEKNRAAADETLHTATIRSWIEADPDAVADGAKRAGSRAHFTFVVKHDSALDEAVWEAAEPESYAEWQRMTAAVAEQAETAKLLYSRPTRSTRLNIYANKEQA